MVQFSETAPVRSRSDVVRESLITGVAIADSDLESGLSGDEIRTPAGRETVDRRTRPGAATSFEDTGASDSRTARYRADVDPEFAERTQHITERERDPDNDPDDTRPAEQADGDPVERDHIEGRPAEQAGRRSESEGGLT